LQQSGAQCSKQKFHKFPKGQALYGLDRWNQARSAENILYKKSAEIEVYLHTESYSKSFLVYEPNNADGSGLIPGSNGFPKLS
jgi:hypothetical protein